MSLANPGLAMGESAGGILIRRTAQTSEREGAVSNWAVRWVTIGKDTACITPSGTSWFPTTASACRQRSSRRWVSLGELCLVRPFMGSEEERRGLGRLGRWAGWGPTSFVDTRMSSQSLGGGRVSCESSRVLGDGSWASRRLCAIESLSSHNRSVTFNVPLSTVFQESAREWGGETLPILVKNQNHFPARSCEAF